MASVAQNTSSAKRICQVIQVNAEHLDEYKKIHTEVWPTVLSALSRAHITDYSIFFLPSPPYPSPPTTNASSKIAGLLIATMKYTGLNYEEDMKTIGDDPETKRWWALTDKMQTSLYTKEEGSDGGSEGGKWWWEAEEVFRFEG